MTFSRRPRGAIKVNGDELAGWLYLETEENEFSAPDTFRATFAMAGLPADRAAAYWAAVKEAEVEFFMGKPADAANYTPEDLVSVFLGKVDDVDLDWTERTITISGRDLTAPMIDTKTSEKFVNLTSSAIVAKIAAKHGLEFDGETTTTKAGRFYEIDHVDINDQRTEWDLVTWLAREEGFSTFVQGRRLVFKPRDPDASPAFIIRNTFADGERDPSSNYERLSTSRSLMLAGDLRVTVKSWHSKKKATFTKTAVRRGGGGGPRQDRTYTIPGLSPDEAQAKAEAILKDLSRHVMRLDYEGAGRETCHVSDTILLEGTDTLFDGIYFPAQIVRRISKDDGWTWRIEAKNSPPEDEATL